jgi:tetratricopeptide (TPR) repeat protein
LLYCDTEPAPICAETERSTPHYPISKKASLLAPDSIEIKLKIGAALQQLELLGEAVAAYNCVCAIDPDNFFALTNKAIALHEGGHPEDALTALKLATSLAPNDPVILLKLGTALFNKFCCMKRLPNFQSATKLAPDYAAVWSSLRVTLQAIRDTKTITIAPVPSMKSKPYSHCPISSG